MTTDRRRLFDVSWRAIAKVLVAVALVWAWFQLWQFVMVIVVAIIIAVALDPVVRYLERHRVPRWLGACGSVLLLAAVAVGDDCAELGLDHRAVAVHSSKTSPSSISRFAHRFPRSSVCCPRPSRAALASTRCRFGRSAASAVGDVRHRAGADGVSADRVEADGRMADRVRAAGPSAEGAPHARRSARRPSSAMSSVMR